MLEPQASYSKPMRRLRWIYKLLDVTQCVGVHACMSVRIYVCMHASLPVSKCLHTCIAHESIKLDNTTSVGNLQRINVLIRHAPLERILRHVTLKNSRQHRLLLEVFANND